MSSDKITRLRRLHERMRTMQKEIQQIQYDIWDLCKDMETEEMLKAIAKSDEVAA